MTYFKPWRRKLGAMTLAMACVYAALWIRGITIHAMLALPTDDDLHPYSYITITLTLLAVWLLLSKPRVKPSAPVSPQ